MAAAFEVVLPHGVVRDGERRVDALVRTPSGDDERFLLERRGATRAERVSGLLARCVVELGGVAPRIDDVRGLTVGDREALLLHLHAALLGGRIACVVDCPACGERLDLDIEVADALVAPYAAVPGRREATVAGFEVRFRLPTGDDQEAAARTGDPVAGAALLLERCVVEVIAEGKPVAGVPAEVEAALPDLLAELDPQAEALVALRCPACEADAQVLLDASTILLGELASSSDTLFLEVHALALHYHWSEGEILGLDVARRRRYLELLADGDGVLA